MFRARPVPHRKPAAHWNLASPALARSRAFAVPPRLAASALGERACPLLLARGVAQGALAGGFRRRIGVLAPLAGHHLTGSRPVALPARLRRRESLRPQRRRRLPGQDRDPPAHLGKRPLERLRLRASAGVLRPRLASAAALRYA